MKDMRPIIGEALALGIPVISGVNKMNVEPFQAFADGMAVAAGPDLDALAEWAEQAVAETA